MSNVKNRPKPQQRSTHAVATPRHGPGLDTRGVGWTGHLLVLLCLGLAACGDDDTTTAPPAVAMPAFEPAACEMPLPSGQDSANVKCGFVTVPEDRSRPESRTLRLAVAVLRATGPARAEDPIINLGAGIGPVLDFSMQLFTADFAAPLQGARDLVFFDQRGSGHSLPSTDCPEVVLARDQYAVDQSVEADTARDVQSQLDCHDRLLREGVNLAAYTTKALADDARDVLRALGYRSWNLYGFSQSTRIAQVLMRGSPVGEIRSVVLDSPIPLAHVHLLDSAANYERLLGLIGADCAADPSCASVYPDTSRLVFDIISQLNAMPLTIRPTDSQSGERYTAVFSGDRLALATAFGLQSAQLAIVYPSLVTSISGRRTTLLAAIAGQIPGPGASGLLYSVICNDQVPAMTPEAIAHALQGVRPELAHAFRAGDIDLNVGVCRGWGGAQTTQAPLSSDIPTLILSGQYDPAVPPPFAAEVARTLSHSRVLEFRGYGHGELYTFASPDAPTCAGRVMGDFFSHPERPPDAGCVAELPPPHFFGT